jgi:cytochrome c biogenesis protein
MAMSAAVAGKSRALARLLALISDLRLAIVLLLLLALASGIGTAIPQRESAELYHRLYDAEPWLGLLRGDAVLALQLDHVYSSGWFLALLAWLGLALLLCSWRRQWPALQASLRWIDYRSPRQLSKLALAETVDSAEPEAALERLAQALHAGGWQLRRQPQRLAARRGIVGRVGPLLVHAGLVLLLVGGPGGRWRGSVWSSSWHRGGSWSCWTVAAGPN